MKTSQHIICFTLFLSLFISKIFCQTNQSSISKKPLLMDTVITNSNLEFFPIYGLDDFGLNKIIRFYLPIDQKATLKDKITIIINNLSNYCFRGLPIELLQISDSSNMVIAHINLKESNYYLNKNLTTWKTLYFQGSHGGSSTSITLIESLLQRKYPNKWIDAVMFYYEDNPIDEWEWDHIALDGIRKR